MEKDQRKRINQKTGGFSLIELIIAVAILVVLSGLLAPQLLKYVERSREAKDMQMLDSIYVAVNTALANEEAYDAFNEMGTGVYRKTITAIYGQSDAFSKEIQSVLGADVSKFTLSSRSARANNAQIYVTIYPKDSTTSTSYLSVRVYAGVYKQGDTPNAGFEVGGY